MTRDREIERVLDAFYAEGPTEMPDRVFLGVFDRIDRVPQRRLARLETRINAMTVNLRFVAAAAIAVGVFIVGLTIVGPRFGSLGASSTPIATTNVTLPPPSGSP